MDLTVLSKDDLIKIAKVNDIKNYSKLKKDQFIELVEKTKTSSKTLTVPDDIKIKLDKAKEKNTKKASKKEKGPAKPKSEKLDKKLAKFVNLEEYKDTLIKLENPSDDELLNIVSAKVSDFVGTITPDDHKKYVNTYGALKLIVEYLKKNKASISNLTEEQLCEKLSLYLYDKDENLHKALLDKIKKYIIRIKKIEEKAKNPTQKKVEKKPKVLKEDDKEEEEMSEEDPAEEVEESEEE